MIFKCFLSYEYFVNVSGLKIFWFKIGMTKLEVERMTEIMRNNKIERNGQQKEKVVNRQSNKQTDLYFQILFVLSYVLRTSF